MTVTTDWFARKVSRAVRFCPGLRDALCAPTLFDAMFGDYTEPDWSGVLTRGIVPCDRYTWVRAAPDVKDWGWLL